jgi:DNA sulfur modification protein DndB
MKKESETKSDENDVETQVMKWRVPALRGVMGSWVYYPALMTAKQLSSHVVTDKDIREAEGLDDYLQRDLHPRVKRIVEYLKGREDRFFPAIIIGIFDGIPGWIPFNLTSLVDESELQHFDESMGVLVFDGSEKMFALDGQHRVKAIQETSDISGVAQDQYAVIFVAHVDDKNGKVRTRRLFSDINKNAVKVSGGDLVIIDEDGVASIVTRRVFAEYEHFDQGSKIAVTEKTEQVDKEGKAYFTSLLALNTVVKTLKPLYRKKKGTKENSAENVKALQQVVQEFFTFVIENVKAYNDYFVSKSLVDLAEVRKGNKNLLFRPIGLEILARVYVIFYKQKKLNVLKKAIKATKFESPGGFFDGIVWNSGKIESSSKAKTATVNLFLFVSGLLASEKDSELRDSLRELLKRPDYELPEKYKL